MRIQHNIMAMNAYRNYNNNTSALSKNLEKLSSGYKINRAGDDAAGLAISEKMRAQITGLQTAQKNVKDGISLVKTGEGAMQEVQDMLNRMVELATQSANGTYDNEVDRDNLQKEVDQLKTEIDRIADSANFNGIKLLDGSLAESKVDLTSATIGGADGTITNVAATGAKSDITVAAAGTTGDHKLTVEYATADGSLKKVELTYNVKNTTGANNQATAIRDAISKNAELSAIFDVGGTAAKVELTSKVTGEKGAKVVSMSSDDTGVITATNAAVTAGTNAKTTVDNIAGVRANDSITLNGKTYEFVNKAGDKTSIDGATAVVLGKDPDATVAALNAALDGTGISVKNDGGKFMFTADQNGAGLTLQIGDTSDDYNQMTVKIGDVHVQALGLNGVSVASQDAAQAAVKSIKDAINTVSSIRGTLGATQNRLEHTQNNLSVMTENIQDAESTIRDTDVADEMMAYTKNNILVQSAQAMLAQANQVPQGVLQLLQ
ncbi:flagellin N-terminal helical domain-containing protein [Agathobaculum desmolans]|uniref:flagellin N-terminal helical domain-containing protein n=1 Tax=Agathobaculum desmolans TaxID=39484 RepID=UPI0004E1FF77|nr:flagellin [Agathobaculum desmolans]